MAVHRTIPLSNGTIHMARVTLVSPTEDKLTYREEVIIDLANQIDDLKDQLFKLKSNNSNE